MTNISTPIKVLLVCVPAVMMAVVFLIMTKGGSYEVPPAMTVQEKKARFQSIVLPAIDSVYAELMEQYQQADKLIESGDGHKLADLKEKYQVTSNEGLLLALKPHPKSIALAQAAIESSWATSRFFREANNVFGVWSFDADEPRIAAGEQRGDKTVWLKKYPTVEASVKDYFRILAQGKAFNEFRKLKMKTSDPYALVTKLDKYSEKGTEYGKDLSAIIEFNKFFSHDS